MQSQLLFAEIQSYTYTHQGLVVACMHSEQFLSNGQYEPA